MERLWDFLRPPTGLSPDFWLQVIAYVASLFFLALMTATFVYCLRAGGLSIFVKFLTNADKGR
jgi:hypothetical protein